MIDIDEFCELLDEVCDELPEEFYRELHHGIVVDESAKVSPHATNNDLWILGDYQRTGYGNKITIYYGSFEKMYGWLDRERLREKLREVVRHEFRHHMENLSGMHGADSLEREDIEFIKQYKRERQ